MVLLFTLSTNAIAKIELSLIKPLNEFTTNDGELLIEGFVSYEKNDTVTISASTPAGLYFDLLEFSIDSMIVDMGTSQSLKAIVFYPIFGDGLSYGPRVVNLSFSNNGQQFDDKGIFNCTSGMGNEYGEARSDFPDVFQYRYARIDIIEGWQSKWIGIKDVNFIDAAGKNIKARARNISVAVRTDDSGYADFHLTVLLREGENQISVSARSKEKVEVEEDYSLVRVTYLPEVAISDKSIILSDGYKAQLVIPSGALASRVKKISIKPIDLSDIKWESYVDNLQIARNTGPVVAYKFDVGAETPFNVTAKDYLERQPPGLVVDRNPDYPSTWITALSPLPVWLKIDLKNLRSIGSITIIPRVKESISYGPEKLAVLVSDDDIDYEEIARKEQCGDNRVDIALSSTPTARYIQIVIEEGKQGNNIQINEVELRDAEGSEIILYEKLSSAILSRTARLSISYDNSDLIRAGIRYEKNLAIFAWNENTAQWQPIGGKLEIDKKMITVNLNYLSTFAVFESIPSDIEVKWSNNPFSPNRDGIADTTTIFIKIVEETGMQAKVEIFNCAGKLIRTLIHEVTQSGHISILWDGRDEDNERVEIGPYIYQVSIGKEVRNGSIIVVR